MRVRRAILYMPGHDREKIIKSLTLGVDSICMDMEDAVLLERKQEAREVVIEALNSLDFGRTEKLIRINPINSGFEVDDLASVIPAHPDGVIIPKVEQRDHIRWVSDRINKIERQQQWHIGEIPILAIIETARGITNLHSIAEADPRVSALIIGAEDLAADIGATRTQEGSEVFYARSALITHAASAGLQAIDMVFVDINDMAGLTHEAEHGAKIGFAGKQIIHPKQVYPVQEAFSPDSDTIEYAVRIIESYEIHQQSGKGVFTINGKMIDAPTLKFAKRILARAQAAGKI